MKITFPYVSPALAALIDGGFLLVTIEPNAALYSVWLGEGGDVSAAASANLHRIARENGIAIPA